jgi:hypothetical protein
VGLAEGAACGLLKEKERHQSPVAPHTSHHTWHQPTIHQPAALISRVLRAVSKAQAESRMPRQALVVRQDLVGLGLGTGDPSK